MLRPRSSRLFQWLIVLVLLAALPITPGCECVQEEQIAELKAQLAKGCKDLKVKIEYDKGQVKSVEITCGEAKDTVNIDIKKVTSLVKATVKWLDHLLDVVGDAYKTTVSELGRLLDKFLACEKLTEQDVKDLDANIKKLLESGKLSDSDKKILEELRKKKDDAAKGGLTGQQKLELIGALTKALAHGVSVPRDYELASAYASLNGHPVAMVVDRQAQADLRRKYPMPGQEWVAVRPAPDATLEGVYSGDLHSDLETVEYRLRLCLEPKPGARPSFPEGLRSVSTFQYAGAWYDWRELSAQVTTTVGPDLSWFEDQVRRAGAWEQQAGAGAGRPVVMEALELTQTAIAEVEAQLPAGRGPAQSLLAEARDLHARASVTVGPEAIGLAARAWNKASSAAMCLPLDTASLGLVEEAAAPVELEIVAVGQVVAGEAQTLTVIDKQGSVVAGAVVALADQKAETDATGRARIRVPEGAALLGLIGLSATRHREGERPQVSQPRYQAVASARGWEGPPDLHAVASPVAIVGMPYTLYGRGFSGEADENTVRIGDQTARVLAAAPDQVICAPPTTSPVGPQELSVETPAGRTHPMAIEVVKWSLALAKQELSPGERTTATITYQGSTRRIRASVELRGGNVHFARGAGPEMVVESSGGADNKAVLQIQAGAQPGPFAVMVQPEPEPMVAPGARIAPSLE